MNNTREEELIYQYILRQYAKLLGILAPLAEAGVLESVLMKRLSEEMQILKKSVTARLEIGITRAWNDANKATFKLMDKKFSKVELPESVRKVLYDPNKGALEKFIKREKGGMNLSDRVWEQTKEARKIIKKGLVEGIENGTPARDISKNIKEALLAPETPTPSKGVYKSPIKNAMRVVRTEVNASYRTADQANWNKNPIVLGYKIQVSNTRSKNVKARCELCRTMEGIYPNTFQWSSWHPNCYSDDSEVMTNNGWKLFKDLKFTDLIYSLNPDNNQPEYVKYIVHMQRKYKGDMVRFSNRALDILVTPEHKMVYLNKSNASITKCEAKDYNKNKGAIYRSTDYVKEDVKSIEIGSHVIPFDLFCEFMAYYLSDGSCSFTRINQFHIAQDINKSPVQHGIIELLLSKMPIKCSRNVNGFYLRDESFYQYLTKFGKSVDKSIPSEILNASPRQIQIFLDAFIMCDGHIKKPKSFMGNRGSICEPKEGERMYFTTSNIMASQLGELITKIGRRPSFRSDKAKGKTIDFKNGSYTMNNNCWTISECRGKTATVFNKDIEHYDGLVYDIQLERNHIMYIRRNGKCFWGSNCLCIKTPIVMTREYLDKYNRLIAQGEDTAENIKKLQVEAGLITKLPNQLTSYVEGGGGKKTWWYSTNKKMFNEKKD